MIVINQTNKIELTDNCKQARSYTDLLFGLLKKSNPRCLLFKTRWGIHTFFLKEPIDILVLDKNHQIMQIGHSIKSNSLYFWNPKYTIVIELPQGLISKTQTKVGDILQLKP
jgi:uncharacterized membrane protein (UPF0127 family)